MIRTVAALSIDPRWTWRHAIDEVQEMLLRALGRHAFHVATLSLVSALAACSVAPRRGADVRRGIVDDPCTTSRKETHSGDSAPMDWANLCRYRDADARLISEHRRVRAVFIGDSITDSWIASDPSFFANGIVDRGISGQTTPQMLLRFRQDVIALRPQVVHILAGTNDIAGNGGPTTLREIEDNVRSMVELAEANGIYVILGSVLPTVRYPWNPGIHPESDIRALNAWMAAFAVHSHAGYVDYHSALVNESGGFADGLSIDGVHPNDAGYKVMESLAAAALRAAPTGIRTDCPDRAVRGRRADSVRG